MQRNAFHSAQWLLAAVHHQKNTLLVAMFLAAIKVILGLGIVFTIYHLLGPLLAGQLDTHTAMPFVITIMVLILLRYCCLCLSAFLSHKIAFAMVADIKIALTKKLLQLPMSFFSTHRSSDIRQIIDDDVNRIETFVAHHITDVLTALLTPILAALMLVYVSWPLALISLLPLPLAFIAQALLFRGYSQQLVTYQQALSSMNKQSTELIRNIAISRMLRGDNGRLNRLAQSANHYANVVDRWTRKSSTVHAFLKVVLDVNFILLLPVSLFFFINPIAGYRIDMAQWIIVMLLGLTLMQPLYQLLMFSGLLNQLLDGVKRIQLVEQSKPVEQGNEPWPDKPYFVFQSVSYFYNEDQPLLNNINLQIDFGEKIAIVGASGSGKSTLLQLMAKCYLPTSGQVLCNGKSLTSYDEQTMYQHIAYVPQDPYMVYGSIRDNLLYEYHGETGDIDDHRIWETLSLVEADNFIKACPQQLDLLLGSEHQRLSGGEKQRIVLARALLKSVNTYFFDEVTRFFDPQTETRVLDNLFNHQQDSTIIFVTHRFSNLVYADRIIVVDDGHIVGFDTHKNLFEHCSPYQTLYQTYHQNGSPKQKSTSDLTANHHVNRAGGSHV